MSEVKGIKEISELLNGVEMLGVVSKKVMADGKISLADAGIVFEAVQKYKAVVAAFQGINDVPAEVKDLSAEEANLLLSKLLSVVQAIKAA